jgi:hypothetical protein
MKGIDAKRGIAATLERIWAMAKKDPKRLTILFGGEGARCSFEGEGRFMKARVQLPALDDIGEVSQAHFNDVIGFVLHEFGHTQYTKNEPWEKAVAERPELKDSKLPFWFVNAMEDIRIEGLVIQSGLAGNAKALFEGLVDGQDVSDVKFDIPENVPYVLAVEGRRLNNDYALTTRDLLAECPWADNVRCSLDNLKDARSTADSVRIALDLYDLLFPDAIPDAPPPSRPRGEGGDGDEVEDGDEDGDEEELVGKEGKEDDKRKRVSGGGGSAKSEGIPDAAEVIKRKAKKVATSKDVFNLPVRTKPIMATIDFRD